MYRTWINQTSYVPFPGEQIYFYELCFTLRRPNIHLRIWRKKSKGLVTDRGFRFLRKWSAHPKQQPGFCVSINLIFCTLAIIVPLFAFLGHVFSCFGTNFSVISDQEHMKSYPSRNLQVYIFPMVSIFICLRRRLVWACTNISRI